MSSPIPSKTSADHVSAIQSPSDMGSDAAYMESMYLKWRNDQDSVPESWRYFFMGMTYAAEHTSGSSATSDEARDRLQSRVASLIFAYRSIGHLAANVDPLGSTPSVPETLQMSNWGFQQEHLSQIFDTGHLKGPERLPLSGIIKALQDTYCGFIGVEYMHIQDRDVRRWLQQQMEPVRNRPQFSHDKKLFILQGLTDAEQFEKFTHSRYPGQKRFSLEGGESLISGLQALIEIAPSLGFEEIVLGMAHRGRLNVLANILGMSLEMIFSEFEGNVLPDTVHGDGDVKYHKGYSSIWTTRDGQKLPLSLTANPSHLEAVNPVVEGRVRAKQRQRNDTEFRRKVLPLLIHGDAAFSGQGVVAETLNLSQLDGYRTGGTVHVIINNQIGFTTLPSEGRSSVHCTDVAKMVEAPIFHVNGDEPESVVFASELALKFRQEFARDVVIDMVCYRRHGHNEGDDPAFTQPVLYAKIKDRPSARELFLQRLVEQGVLTRDEADRQADDFRQRLETARTAAKERRASVHVRAFEGLWDGLNHSFSHKSVKTGVVFEKLHRVARTLSEVPEGFHLNPKVIRQLKKRLKSIEQKETIDWAFAELLAFGTLLQQGIPVRLSGQDSARGTFSQRHAVWQDLESQKPYVPLNHIGDAQAKFCVYNSSLSEASVLGFEYGYSLSEPQMLILWEAQFGDFVNGAQVIIDQFITGAESKWQRDSGIVLLLPHGQEGQGPEHSHAYLERFLTACAENNVQVCNLTTPAQYFHLLRRQMLRKFRCPLILMTPKSMLRNKLAVSPVDELLAGGFEEILPDKQNPKNVRRVVLCSGKVYWDLAQYRREHSVSDVAIVRIEQLYPLHWQKFTDIMKPYQNVEEVVWVQEETQNRGAWNYMFPKLLELFAADAVGYVGREASASPATGSLHLHREEQRRICHDALEGPFWGKSEKGNDEARNQGARGWRVDHRGSFDRVV